ncbi:hypothetical protein DPMN_012969 [Dreissena polymorpha]|uniref:Uncharacterized protein n=1 Tax=Dreissena polymorpha TaxID=45954 RepID=A0A9D4N803_DREPO|nr:hypothetical protein DPMN_012969 [Dreissena polymorpha]
MDINGGQLLFGSFVRTLSVDELRFAQTETSYVDSVYWGSLTIGRLASLVLSYFIPTRILVLVYVLMKRVAITFADIFATRGKNFLWTLTAVVGFFSAPISPADIAYINTQIEVRGMVLTMVQFASGFGQFLNVSIGGVLYESYGPRTMFYALQFSAIFVCIISVVSVTIYWKRKRAANNKDQEQVFTSGHDVATTSDLRCSDIITSN